MLRRLLVIGCLVLGLALGVGLVLPAIRERAWEHRRQELLRLAEFPSELRRPHELRLESLWNRLASSPRFDELVDSPHRPLPALGDGAPRTLSGPERIWIEAAENEFTGLDSVLLELRALPLDTLEWHGETARLGTQRELVNALCGRAWLALEGQDQARAVLLYADALRLNRASDDGTTMGGMIRYACDHTVLASLRAALALGLSPALARTALAPLLEDWSYDPGRAERVIRRDLAALENAGEQEESWSPAQGLEMLRGVERALELTGGPVEEVIRLRAERDPARPERGIVTWLGAPWYLHARHARRTVALTALAVAAFREEHGRWPESLAALDLPAEQTLDTLETEPLAYVSGADWARVGPASWGERAEPWNGAGESPYAWTLR